MKKKGKIMTDDKMMEIVRQGQQEAIDLMNMTVANSIDSEDLDANIMKLRVFCVEILGSEAFNISLVNENGTEAVEEYISDITDAVREVVTELTENGTQQLTPGIN